jgi:exopolyphosphatase/guanosine-5'-triphosphate,3'-diphosphate pyrophosphatase
VRSEATQRPGDGPLAVLDLGSNTVLLLVMDPGGRVRLERAEITRLGEGVFERGRLADAARVRTLEVVGRFAREARAAGAGFVLAVGTEALRRASDGREFLADLVARGLVDRARLLSGEEEAVCAIEATRRSRAQGAAPPVVIDVGGGSTEVAWTRDDSVLGVSLPLGTVRLTERFVKSDPPAPAELAAIADAIERELAPLAVAGPPLGAPVVAVAGTATTLAALELALEPYDAERVEGMLFTARRLAEWRERLAGQTVERRRELPGMEPGRADVIVAGLAILEGALAALGASEFRVSGRGVRHGVALRLLDGAEPVC